MHIFYNSYYKYKMQYLIFTLYLYFILGPWTLRWISSQWHCACCGHHDRKVWLNMGTLHFELLNMSNSWFSTKNKSETIKSFKIFHFLTLNVIKILTNLIPQYWNFYFFFCLTGGWCWTLTPVILSLCILTAMKSSPLLNILQVCLVFFCAFSH